MEFKLHHTTQSKAKHQTHLSYIHCLIRNKLSMAAIFRMSNVDLRNNSSAFDADAKPVDHFSMVPSNRQMSFCKTTNAYEDDTDSGDDDDDQELVITYTA